MKRTLAIPKANIIIAYLDSIVATLISEHRCCLNGMNYIYFPDILLIMIFWVSSIRTDSLKMHLVLYDPSIDMGDGMFEDVCKGEAHQGFADFSVAHLCLEILEGPLEVWEAAAASSLSSTLVSFNSWLQQLELFPNKMLKV